MKKIGIINAELSYTIARLAHNDMILIGDAGMPCPPNVKFIDLAVMKGVPQFIDVLDAVLLEMKVATAFIDQEQKEISRDMHERLMNSIDGKFEVIEISHDSLKELSKECKAVIRTGEFTPYSNIILKSDCLF